MSVNLEGAWILGTHWIYVTIRNVILVFIVVVLGNPYIYSGRLAA